MSNDKNSDQIDSFLKSDQLEQQLHAQLGLLNLIPKSEPKIVKEKKPRKVQGKTFLYQKFVFWFCYYHLQKGKQTSEEYEECNKRISEFDTIEGFWKYYQHIVRPDRLPTGAQFFLFKDQIKPMWEVGENIGGGRVQMRIKKDFSNKIWEDLILNYVGDECSETKQVCGLQMSVKPREVLFSLWTKEVDHDMLDSIKQWLREAIGFSNKINFEFKPHPGNKKKDQDGYYKNKRKK